MADAEKLKDFCTLGTTQVCLVGWVVKGQHSQWVCLPGIGERTGMNKDKKWGKLEGVCNCSLAIADQRKTSFDLDLAQQSTEHPTAIPVHGRLDHHQD